MDWFSLSFLRLMFGRKDGIHDNWLGAYIIIGISYHKIRYPLLLKELLRHTDKTSKDYANLTSAQEKIEAVVAIVNEGTRALGEREKLVALQGRIDSSVASV